MADKVKETALEEAERIKALATDAYKSYAYIYPVKVCFPVYGALATYPLN